MVRITAGKTSRLRRKKYFKITSGYRVNGHLASFSKEQSKQSLNFAYISRRLKKREFRRVWIKRLSSALSILGSSYSKFMGKLLKQNILLNRKILSELALSELGVLKALLK